MFTLEKQGSRCGDTENGNSTQNFSHSATGNREENCFSHSIGGTERFWEALKNFNSADLLT